MKTLIVFCALGGAAACAQAAGLFDNATAVQPVSETQSAAPSAAPQSAAPAAPKPVGGVVQGSVQYSVGGKTLAPGNLPMHSKLVKTRDGKTVRVFIPSGPEAAAQPATARGEAGVTSPETASQAPSAPVAPVETAVAASTASAALPATTAAATDAGYAVFVMPDGRRLRVDASGKPAGVSQADASSMEWTLELPGEAPIKITPEMVSAGNVTLPDGRVIKIASAAELAAQKKAQEEKQGLFSHAETVDSRLAHGGENRAIPVTYVLDGQAVSITEKVDAAASPAPASPAQP